MEDAVKLPPLFSPVLISGQSPWDAALTVISAGQAEAGQVFYIEQKNRLELALILEPDVVREKAQQMLHVMMVAIGDALGAIIPPEIAIQYRWPNGLLANGARFGSVNLQFFGDDEEADYLVLGVKFTLRDDIEDIDPGLYEGTTLWDEGCGELELNRLIESICRHFQLQLNTWQEEAFAPIHQTWVGRYDDNKALLLEDDVEANFIGLDEMGNGLLKINGNSILKNLRDLELGQKCDD
jgi:biotin-(acetyl-CoA carboxylase) ligase